jgi:diphosphomevalonate decarboxylase
MRVADAPRRIDICRKAILERDFDALAQMVEQDCHIMHAVMMTSTPPLLYWQPATLGVMQKVLTWRAEGLAVCYTIDAGANVHVLCPAPLLETVVQMLKQVEGVKQIFAAHPGGAVQIGD